MGRKTKPSKRTAVQTPTQALRAGPNWPLLALSALGIALAGYLSWTAFANSQVQGCAVGGGCDLVLSSRWATLLGLPTAFWGLLGYVSLAAIAFVPQVTRQWLLAWTVAGFGVAFSIYLTIVALTIIGATCPYCLTSLALMTAIFGLVVWQRPPELAERSWAGLILSRGAIIALAILIVHGNNIRPAEEPTGPEDPDIRALAEYLSDEDVLFYGASWCPHCQEQKALFGASVSRLPYIECGPAGPNGPQAPSCRAAGIQSYPTWVIKGRTVVGQVMTLLDLAEASGYPDAARFR